MQFDVLLCVVHVVLTAKFYFILKVHKLKFCGHIENLVIRYNAEWSHLYILTFFLFLVFL